MDNLSGCCFHGTDTDSSVAAPATVFVSDATFQFCKIMELAVHELPIQSV